MSENDSGIYDAWNKGIKKAKGKFLSFVGLDDRLCANYSDDYLKVINEYPNIDFVSSKMLIKTNILLEFGEKWNWNNFRKQMNVVHPGSLHNRELFIKYGLYDTYFKIAGDYEFLLRIGDNLNEKFINTPTVFFSLDGVSNSKSFQLSKEIRFAKIKNNTRSIYMINIEFVIRYSIAIISFFKKKLQTKYHNTLIKF